ncbi:major facilitator superfamily domain-containing protein [Ditylenchus destructor]|uniref:Major facilitator superfamily domain-containing protein n=1 Tax=Ditylenchus destructor TaxID=166010 RepID=A0AAD4N7G9_9BILA|nr:major facilitator superfamily domain-containing protein [Ditylenchus destructor]
MQISSRSGTTALKIIGWKPAALDGGYGWVVVAGAFLIHVIADGFVYSFGIIEEELIEKFGASHAQASIIVSLLTGLTLCVGPVASALSNRFDCRVPVIVGSVLVCAGCIISSFATSIGYLIGSCGILMGIGCGLMYCPALIIVTMYFEKYRSLATGITVCGSGVGTLIFPKILGLLMDRFEKGEGWRKIFLLYSVLVLLCVPCGLLFSPLGKEPIYENREEEIDDSSTSMENTKLISHKSHKGRTVPHFLPTENAMVRSEPVYAPIPILAPKSAGYLNVTDCFYPRSIQREHKTDPVRLRTMTRMNSTNPKRRGRLSPNLPLCDMNEEESGMTANRADSEYTTSIWSSIKKMMDLSLFCEPAFVVFTFANFLMSIGFDPPTLFMPMHVTAKKWCPLKSNKTTAVSLYGLANVIGSIVYGVVCDIKFPCSWGKDCARNRLWICIVSTTLCGLACCFVYLIQRFWLFAVYCFFFGFTITCTVSLPNVILADLLGVTRLTNAFGLFLLVQGVADFIAPPLAGKLFDITRNYDWSFAFSGISLTVGALLLITLFFIKKPLPEDELCPEELVSVSSVTRRD